MTRWKYDSDPRDELVDLRIPVTSKWPMMPYLAAFHKESPRRPTVAEAKTLHSFIRMRRFTFSPQERLIMSEEAFDFHPRSTTVVFHKYAQGDWGYRRANWQTDGFAPPSPRTKGRTVGPLTLVQVMDLYFSDAVGSIDARWDEWKVTHPGVFG